MPRGKKELAEQIIPKLREVEVEVGRGKTVAGSLVKPDFRQFAKPTLCHRDALSEMSTDRTKPG